MGYLLQIVLALHTRGGLADFLRSRQEQANENGEDNEQLNQGKSFAVLHGDSSHL
jgi:hypothetical protein